MIIPLPVMVVAGLFVSGYTRLNAVIFGQPVSVSALDLIALAVLLALLLGVLVTVRLIVRDRPRRRPVYCITALGQGAS